MDYMTGYNPCHRLVNAALSEPTISLVDSILDFYWIYRYSSVFIDI